MNIMKWDFEKKTPLNQSGVFIKYAKRSFIKKMPYISLSLPRI